MSVIIKKRNQCLKDILISTILATTGLASFGVGLYLSIQANIGVAPWDTFYLGLSEKTGIQYGNISIAASFIILIFDYLMKERIGIGTLIDAVIVGKTVDFCLWLDFIPAQQKLWSSLLLMFFALFIMGFSQYLYMKAGLCCGPRDGMLLGICKKFSKVPIGIISSAILCVVLFFGWRLDGPIGLGTLICVFLQGPIMQVCFALVHFRPTKVEHQDLIQSIRVIFGKEGKK